VSKKPTNYLLIALAGAALAGVTGCATQDAVSQQTEPLKAQVSKLGEALQASSGNVSQTQEMLAAAEARERAMAQRVDALVNDVKALHDRLATQERVSQAAALSSETAAERLGEQLVKADLRLDELASLAHDLAARVDADGDKQNATSALAASSAERLTQAEQRLDGIAAQLLASVAEGARLRQEIGAGADQARDLAGRVTHAEAALDRLGASLPERMTRLEARMDELTRLARSAMELAAQNDIRRNGKVAFTTVLTGDKTLYPLNLQIVGAQDRAALEAMVQRIKALNKEYHLEIQGHTDNTSVDDSNYQLGKARAEVIKRYLHENGGIPLGWMSVISYGATQPIDPQSNTNRRIVIQTLVLDGE
jgi:outer membrane protein OmpA-like peptidoglycan-associated protein